MKRTIARMNLGRPAKSAQRALGVAAGVIALSFALPSFAVETAAAPSMAGESAHIKPAGERAIGIQERPTIKKKAAEQARDQRGYRVSLQIPEA
ncbi:MAG TPA: hypothetical protein VF294_14905, partial [Polyangiaceae bacterium]